jgi:hypothetical protein
MWSYRVAWVCSDALQPQLLQLFGLLQLQSIETKYCRNRCRSWIKAATSCNEHGGFRVALPDLGFNLPWGRFSGLVKKSPRCVLPAPGLRPARHPPVGSLQSGRWWPTSDGGQGSGIFSAGTMFRYLLNIISSSLLGRVFLVCAPMLCSY